MKLAKFQNSCLEVGKAIVCLDGKYELNGEKGGSAVNLASSMFEFVGRLYESKPFKSRINDVKIVYGNGLSRYVLFTKNKFYIEFELLKKLRFKRGEWVEGVLDEGEAVLRVNGEEFREKINFDARKKFISLVFSKKLCVPAHLLNGEMENLKLKLYDPKQELVFEVDPWGHNFYVEGIIGRFKDKELFYEWYKKALNWLIWKEVVEYSSGPTMKMVCGNFVVFYNQKLKKAEFWGYQTKGFEIAVRNNMFVMHDVERKTWVLIDDDGKNVESFSYELGQIIWGLLKWLNF